MSPRWLRVATAVAIAALVAWSFAARWHVLAASPFPLGVDGYFYPIQLRALLEHGALHDPTSPLTLWWMLPLAAVTDPITGAKLGAALGGALIAVPAYGVGARLGKSRGAGLIAAAIATGSASSRYLSVEFVKQSIGLTVGLAALWLALRAIERRSRGRVVAAAAAVVAVLLAHKLAAAIVLAIAVPAALATLRGRQLRIALGGLAVAGVAAAVLGALSPTRFPSLGDLGLLAHLLGGAAHWSAPALATGTTTLAFDHEAALGGVLAIIAVFVVRRTERAAAERVACWLVIALALVIAVPWLDVTDPQGLAFRLRIAAFVPLALVAAIVLGAALRDAEHVVLALAIVSHAGALTTIEGEVVTHPALVAAALAVADYARPGATLIVPERHIAFMVEWYARVPIALRPDDVPYAQRVRLMPLAFFGRGSPLDLALDAARNQPALAPPIGVHPSYRNGLVLVEEATWDWILTQLPTPARQHFAAWPTI